MDCVLLGRAGSTKAAQNHAKMTCTRLVTLADVEVTHVRFVAGTT